MVRYGSKDIDTTATESNIAIQDTSHTSQIIHTPSLHESITLSDEIGSTGSHAENAEVRQQPFGRHPRFFLGDLGLGDLPSTVDEIV